jgi:hypothetical protein
MAQKSRLVARLSTFKKANNKVYEKTDLSNYKQLNDYIQTSMKFPSLGGCAERIIAQEQFYFRQPKRHRHQKDG